MIRCIFQVAYAAIEGVDIMFKLIGSIRGSKGLTMIETAITMTVALIGAIGGYTLLANVRGTMAGNTAAIEAQQDARNIVERIARELRESSPEQCSPGYTTEYGTHYVSFRTPRDENGKFIVDAGGKPKWQRIIVYVFHKWNSTIYRHQLYLTEDPSMYYDDFYSRYDYEIVAKNVEEMRFNRVRDMITIYIRTYTESGEGEAGHSSRTYAELNTKVKLRN